MTHCGKNHIHRKSYNRKTKTGRIVHVPSSCIRSTSQTGEKTSIEQHRLLKQKVKMHRESREKFGTPKCGPDEIIKEGFKRHSYKRSSGTHVAATDVPPTCIKRITGSHKGKQLFVLQQDRLKKYGYEHIDKMTKQERHTALNRALADKQKPLSLFRRLNALRVLFKDKDPELSKKFEDDADYIESTRAYANRPTAKKKKSRKSK